MPNIVALVTDYAPKKMRIRLVSITLVSFALVAHLHQHLEYF